MLSFLELQKWLCPVYMLVESCVDKKLLVRVSLVAGFKPAKKGLHKKENEMPAKPISHQASGLVLSVSNSFL